MKGLTDMFVRFSYAHVVVVAVLLGVSTLLVPMAQAQQSDVLSDYITDAYGTPPDVPTGPLSEELQFAVKVAFVDSIVQSSWGDNQTKALARITAAKDPRVAWVISDLLRFASSRTLNATLTEAASALLGKEIGTRNNWGAVTDHLIAWDIPAFPDYLQTKQGHFHQYHSGLGQDFCGRGH